MHKSQMNSKALAETSANELEATTECRQLTKMDADDLMLVTALARTSRHTQKRYASTATNPERQAPKQKSKQKYRIRPERQHASQTPLLQKKTAPRAHKHHAIVENQL